VESPWQNHPEVPMETNFSSVNLANLFYPQVMTNSLGHRKWPLEIVDLPIKNGDFP
jgi:hypothetical protein